MKRSFRRKRKPRGFALFAVVILLAVMTAAVATALDDAVASIQTAGGFRASEIIRAGLDVGLDQAIREVKMRDAAELAAPPPQWDIFQGPTAYDPSNVFMEAVAYPTNGPYENQYRVRFGLRPGQRARAPAGEDVTRAYGQIVEVQIGVEAAAAGVPPTEERVSVGVLIPRTGNYAN